MAKMTKAKARKRLKEAANKINKVMFITDLSGGGKLTPQDNNELSKMWSRLLKMSDKLK